MEFRLGSAAFIVVFATYLFLGGMGVTDRDNRSPRDAAYNLLARGIMAGHLYADREVPAQLAQLRDPYDPVANRAFRVDPRGRLQDLSYYRGRLYLYFGVAPALLLFIPWHLLTGGWLPHWVAVVILCSGGLLVNLSLVRAVRAGVFPGSPRWMAAACTLILGLGSYAPVLLARGDMWEIPIAFNYLAVSAALRFLWEALHKPRRRAWWIALASASLGAAFASRFTVLPAAAMLAVPFLVPETRRGAINWVAAAVPLALCMGGVALYNELRFGSPVEFGTRYMLFDGQNTGRLQSFSTSYFWTNVRLELFQGVEWRGMFPFAHEPAEWLLRPNPGGVEHISGALLNAPVLWAALAVPGFLLLRRPGRGFALFAAAAGWATLSAMALLLFFCGANSRYQFEFVPGLALLASIGVMALESALPGAPGVVCRCAWLAALVVSSAFPVLYGIDRCVIDHDYYAIFFLDRGDIADAGHEVDLARMLSPGDPLARLEHGVVLGAEGRKAEALQVFQALVGDFPGDAMAQFNLANTLADLGRPDEAIGHYEEAYRLSPDNPVIRAALAVARARKR
jgi:tetratricopeptide (TPR) repeat protein